MARKSNLRSEVSGSIHFDARTKTVMAVAAQENVKEKVQAVREVVPGKSNNEVVMVLQYYDYNVERAIQAYLEDGAKEALQEWNTTGSKQANKKRKNKKKVNGDKTTEKSGPAPSSSSATEKEEASEAQKLDLPNGIITSVINESKTSSSLNSTNVLPAAPAADVADTTNHTQPSSSSSAPAVNKYVAPPTEPLPQRQPQIKGRGHGDSHYHHLDSQQAAGNRIHSDVGAASGMGDGHQRKPHQGLEKAIKDLHRQTTSLERLRHLLDHEIDRSYKSMKGVFEELRQGLNDREAKLMAEMNVLKKEASEMLEMRQSKAADLKKQVERSDRLKDTEVSELRAEIKHFVSERRHDEELGRTTRFLYDSDRMLDEIRKFGDVVHVKSLYTARKLSVSSTVSSSNHIEGDASNHDSVHQPQEVHELQDRFKHSLKLQDTRDSGNAAGTHLSHTQNGSSNDDVGLSNATSISLTSPSGNTSSDHKTGRYSGNQGPSYNISGSQDRQGSGGGSSGGGFYSQGPRGRGRARGFRGGGHWRGGYSGDRPRSSYNPHDVSYKRPSYVSTSSVG